MGCEVRVVAAEDVAGVVDGFRGVFSAEDATLALVFASARHDHTALIAALDGVLPACPRATCTTAGEIVSGAMLDGTVAVMVLSGDTVRRAVVARVPAPMDPAAIDRALAALAEAHGQAVEELDPAKYVGLVLVDGLSAGEERLMRHLTATSPVPFLGGSAGDDLAFQEASVSDGAQVVPGGAVLVLLEPTRGHRRLKTQSFRVRRERLVPTEVVPERRLVVSFDGRPAAEAYADALGVPSSELWRFLGRNPLGWLVDGEPFVKSPLTASDEGVYFYAAVPKGEPLALLESGDIVGDTKTSLDAAIADLGGARAIVCFSCILRARELEFDGLRDAYGALFRDVPTIGFSTYGEQWVTHVNQTATMLLLA